VAATTEPVIATTNSDTYGIAPRLVLAALSLSAGVVHLVMVPDHIGGWALEGIVFAVVGWLQILLGVGLLMRPRRAMLQATVILNALALLLYVVSRTSGLPVGPNSGVAETMGSIDVLAAVFEGLLVVGSGVLLARPKFLANLSTEGLVMVSAIPVVALLATTVALADPATSEHAHGGGEVAAGTAGGHAHGDSTAATTDLASLASQRCELDINPAADWNETTTAGIDTVMGGTVEHDMATMATPVQGSQELDKVIATTTKDGGEVKDAEVVVALGNVSDDVYTNWLRWLPTMAASHGDSHGASAAAPDDNNGMGGHLGPQPWTAMTDQAQCDQLKAELAQSRDTAMKYPTAADAKKGGWVRVTPYVPGIAAHYMNFRYVDGTFEIDKPEMLLYDGDGDDASMVGLSYYIMNDSSAEPTQGFTGPNDHFHRHVGLCVGAGGVVGDSTTSAEDCAARGGRKADGAGGWMNHVWLVPGCESPWGMFSGATPLLEDDMPKASGQDGGGCAGSGVRARYNLTPGDVSNTPTTVGGSVEFASGG
jgi:hypothetical protein